MARSKKVDLSELAAAAESALEEFLAALADAGNIERDEDEVEDDEEEEAEEVEDDDNEELEELDVLDREEVEGLGIKDLRELAAQYLDDPPKKKAEILEALEEFYDEDEEDDEDEADDEDEDEEDEWDEDSLGELTFTELKKVAREDFEWAAADYKGMDQESLIAALLGDEDEEEEDEEDEADEDEELEELDEDALNAMTHKELIALCKDIDVKVPAKLKTAGKGAAAKKTKAALVELILASADEDDE